MVKLSLEDFFKKRIMYQKSKNCCERSRAGDCTFDSMTVIFLENVS